MSAKGVVSKRSEEVIERMCSMVERGEITGAVAGRRFGITLSGVYHHLKRRRRRQASEAGGQTSQARKGRDQQ